VYPRDTINWFPPYVGTRVRPACSLSREDGCSCACAACGRHRVDLRDHFPLMMLSGLGVASVFPELSGAVAQAPPPLAGRRATASAALPSRRWASSQARSPREHRLPSTGLLRPAQA